MSRAVPEWIGATPDRRSARGLPLTACSAPDPNSGCWIWLKARRWNGYGVIRHQHKVWSAHRLVYEIANGASVPPNIDVCHKCDVPSCVNPDHLFVGTRGDNMRDCAKKGRICIPNLRGEQLPQAKLTEDFVRAIRKDQRSQRAIARDYGVDKGTIANIKHRKTWRHVA
jgi:hypothetical protein